MPQVKLISMTVGLTLLIWVSADQLLKETVELLVNIEPVSAGRAGMSVHPASPHLEPFKVKVVGPRKVISRRGAGGAMGVQLPVTERPTGPHAIELKPALRALSSAFEGLSIVDVDPPVLHVMIDHEVTVSMPVRIEPGTLDYAVSPTVAPPEVQVTISEAKLRGLDPQRKHMTLYVERHLKDWAEGAPFDAQVPLDPTLEGIDVKRVQPSTVRLMAQVQEHRRTIEVSAVPIRFEASLAILNHYAIDRPDKATLLTQRITVRGPAKVIEQIDSGGIKLSGVIVLTSQDVPTLRDADRTGTSFRRVTPTFHLPPGVELTEEPASIEFRLVPIRPPPASDAVPRG